MTHHSHFSINSFWSSELSLKIRVARFFEYLATAFIFVYLGILLFRVFTAFESLVATIFIISFLLWSILDANTIKNVFEKILGVTITLFFVFGLLFALNITTDTFVILSQINQYALIVSFGMAVALPSRKFNIIEMVGFILGFLGACIFGLWFMIQWGSSLAQSILAQISFLQTRPLFSTSILLMLSGVMVYAIGSKSLELAIYIISKALLTLSISLVVVFLILGVFQSNFTVIVSNEIQFFGIMLLAGIIGVSAVYAFFGEKIEKLKELRYSLESKDVYESVRQIFRGLEVGGNLYYIDQDSVVINYPNSQIVLEAGTFAVPILKDGVEVGVVAFGKGRYFFETKIKNFEGTFEGDITLLAKIEEWNNVKAHYVWRLVTPEEITRYSTTTHIEILNLARRRLEEVTKWMPEAETSTDMKEKEFVNIDLPFVKIRVDPFKRKEFVKVGPITVTDESGFQEVKFGPFKFVEITDVKQWAKANFKGMIIDETGESIYFATTPRYIALKIGTMTLYSNSARLRIRDENIIVKMTKTKTKIVAGEFILKMNDNLLKLVSGRIILKVNRKTGAIKYIDSYGRIRKVYDYPTASKIIQQVQEITLDLIRSIIERKSLDRLTNFLSYLDKNLF